MVSSVGYVFGSSWTSVYCLMIKSYNDQVFGSYHLSVSNTGFEFKAQLSYSCFQACIKTLISVPKYRCITNTTTKNIQVSTIYSDSFWHSAIYQMILRCYLRILKVVH